MLRRLFKIDPRKVRFIEWWNQFKETFVVVRAGESFGPYKFLGWGFAGMIEDTTYDWHRHTTYTNYVEDFRYMLEYKGDVYAKKMRKMWLYTDSPFKYPEGFPDVRMTRQYSLGDGPPFVLCDSVRDDRLVGKYFDGSITVYSGDFRRLVHEKYRELGLYRETLAEYENS